MPVDMPPIFVASKPVAPAQAKMSQAIDPKLEGSQVPYKQIRLQYLPNDQVFLPFIKYLRLPTPGWWVTVPGDSGSPGGFGYKFTPVKTFDNDVSLDVSCDARKTLDDAPIIGLLNKPPHEMTQSERDLLVPKMPNADKAYTRFLGSKTAFVHEFELSGKQYYRVEFNANSKNSKVMIPASITFYARPKSYSRYIAKVKASLDSIKWKDIEISGDR